MKRLVQIFTTVFIVSFGLLYIVHFLNKAEGYANGNTITVFNWGDYINPSLVKKFEKESGLKVIYQTFDSNEAMMTKISQGGATFDIAVPSEYAIEKMKEDDLLQPLDHKLLPNLKYINERFLNLPFDKNNKYSIPYFWGTVGIVFNTKLIEGSPPTSWEDLWDEKYHNEILLVDGAREVIGVGLNSLGYSLNDTNEAHLQEAKRKLDLLMPNVKAIVGDEIKMLLANDEAALGVVWSGDAADIMAENNNLDYVIPKEGSNLWFDNVVVPKSATNYEGAHQFINFMLDPENAADNANYVGYSTPNKEALKFLNVKVATDERFYPNEQLTDKLEVYENLGKRMLSHYNDLFLQFKMHRK